MEDKYFTPDIEDIRVGYECEYYLGNSWHKHVVESLYTDRYGCGIFELEQYLQEGSLRVLYLTKEQIEAEGWDYNINYEALEDSEFPDEMGFLKEMSDGKTQYLLYYNPKTLKLRIEKIYDFAGLGWVFKGECKDINTFRWICKLLNV